MLRREEARLHGMVTREGGRLHGMVRREGGRLHGMLRREVRSPSGTGSSVELSMVATKRQSDASCSTAAGTRVIESQISASGTKRPVASPRLRARLWRRVSIRRISACAAAQPAASSERATTTQRSRNREPARLQPATPQQETTMPSQPRSCSSCSNAAVAVSEPCDALEDLGVRRDNVEDGDRVLRVLLGDALEDLAIPAAVSQRAVHPLQTTPTRARVMASHVMPCQRAAHPLLRARYTRRGGAAVRRCGEAAVRFGEGAAHNVLVGGEGLCLRNLT
jgi:hypothetical protein